MASQSKLVPSKNKIQDILKLIAAQFHASNDSLDVSRLEDIYTKDAKVQFGNMPLFDGLDGLRNFFEGIWARLEMMHHEIESFGKT